MRTAAFATLGCKINQYETEAIREEVLGLGYREVPYTDAADVYVVNTCSVTATSGSKSRRYVLRAARRNPDARIVVVGCSTPAEREALGRIPGVAVLAGNEEKALVASFLDGGWKPGDPFPERDADIFRLSISRYSHRTRANVKVQDGCNSFCSFCVIPFLRGRSRSRHPDAAVEEVRRLVDNGYREVIVTGVHLQDYGSDLDPPVTLAGLLRRIAAIPGLARVRLSSLNVRAFTPELFEVLTWPVFCPHWHIPLQAGSDAVLARMRRDYRLADFRAVVERLRRGDAAASIATDVIVGHPGESPEDFDATVAACRELGFSKIHVFPYSVRDATLASKLGGHVELLEIRRRAARLRAVDDELAEAFRRRFLGGTVEVLVEGEAGAGLPKASPSPGSRPSDGPSVLLDGLTERYVRVQFPAPSPRSRERFPGTLQPVRVEAFVDGGLRGLWAGEAREWTAART